jgi:hypothetical protein
MGLLVALATTLAAHDDTVRAKGMTRGSLGLERRRFGDAWAVAQPLRSRAPAFTFSATGLRHASCDTARMLDLVLPMPRLLEIDHVELAAPKERVWQLLRHENLAKSPLIRALFELRGLPERLRGKGVHPVIRIDDLESSEEHPGFQILAEDPGHEVVVGAIGRVWLPEIPFVHVRDAGAYAAFDEPGFVKVAWAVRVLPWGETGTRVEVEVRVDATDDASWPKFKRYFRLIGPASHFIRRTLLASLARDLGTPEAAMNERPLAGDDLLPDASAQLTHGITIDAPPARIWPWLLQMGCGRAGFYSIDALDNGFERSARELHPEWLNIEVGQVLPASPDSDEGFEILRIEPLKALILGGLFDSGADKQLPFGTARPKRYWQVTWAFVLEVLDANTTRLTVRARAAFPGSGRLHVATIRPVHHLMQTTMLRRLAARAEGRLPRDDLGDVLAGIGGAGRMIAALFAPFHRRARCHWGLDEATAGRSYPGDELVPAPRWSYTHGIEIAAPADAVWPWIAQIGADHGGFYSYQWLENLIGCELRNAEVVHPEWQAKVGQALLLHPDPNAPRLQIVALEPGRHFVAHAPSDERARAQGRVWVAASWLLLVEPLGENRCRFISRYRAACSDDLATRLSFGPTLVEPVGFTMDRRMLLGVKERAERAERSVRAEKQRPAPWSDETQTDGANGAARVG